jgi:hypothetical protein
LHTLSGGLKTDLPSYSFQDRELFLAISIELNEISDPEIKESTERVIRNCVGDRPKEEEWRVWIHSLGGYCQITVKGPSQTRERLFFNDIHTLPKKIHEWLDAYPFR